MIMQVYRLIEFLQKGSELDRETAKLIAQAQKFAFNPGLMSEDILDGASGFTRQLMASDIFPMPFDLCLFEFGPGGIIAPGDNGFNFASGEDFCWCVAWREKIAEGNRRADWAIYFRAFVLFKHADGFVSLPAVGQIFTDHFNEDDESRGYFNIVALDRQAADMLSVGRERLRANPALLRWYKAKMKELGASDTESDAGLEKALNEVEEFAFRNMNIAFGQLLTVLGLMSTSAGVQIENVTPTKKFINAMRVKKGKPPLEFEHKIVRIDPALLKVPGTVALGGTHASPRVHWRRGHIRTLADGRKVQVKPCIVGDVTKGTITHDYLLQSSVAVPPGAMMSPVVESTDSL